MLKGKGNTDGDFPCTAAQRSAMLCGWLPSIHVSVDKKNIYIY